MEGVSKTGVDDDDKTPIFGVSSYYPVGSKMEYIHDRYKGEITARIYDAFTQEAKDLNVIFDDVAPKAPAESTKTNTMQCEVKNEISF